MVRLLSLEFRCARYGCWPLATWRLDRCGPLLPDGSPRLVACDPGTVAVQLPAVWDRWGCPLVRFMRSDATAGRRVHLLKVRDAGDGRLVHTERFATVDECTRLCHEHVPPPGPVVLFGTGRRDAHRVEPCFDADAPITDLHGCLCALLGALNPLLPLEETVSLATAVNTLALGDNRTADIATLMRFEADRGGAGRPMARAAAIPPLLPPRIDGSAVARRDDAFTDVDVRNTRVRRTQHRRQRPVIVGADLEDPAVCASARDTINALFATVSALRTTDAGRTTKRRPPRPRGPRPSSGTPAHRALRHVQSNLRRLNRWAQWEHKASSTTS